jgi:hypothetical protein
MDVKAYKAREHDTFEHEHAVVRCLDSESRDPVPNRTDFITNPVVEV